jgi:hypothetical protein
MQGGTDRSDDERIKARIKGIIKQADTENSALFASLLLDTYRMESGRWKRILLIAIVISVVITAAAFTICLLMYRYFNDVK